MERGKGIRDQQEYNFQESDHSFLNLSCRCNLLPSPSLQLLQNSYISLFFSALLPCHWFTSYNRQNNRLQFVSQPLSFLQTSFVFYSTAPWWCITRKWTNKSYLLQSIISSVFSFVHLAWFVLFLPSQKIIQVSCLSTPKVITIINNFLIFWSQSSFGITAIEVTFQYLDNSQDIFETHSFILLKSYT